MNRFLHGEAPGLQVGPRGLRIGLMPEREALLGQVDRGPHILAHPLGVQRPGLVEQADLALGIHLAQEVD